MKESKIDIAVLLIFFVRDKQFKEVFEAVKQARPSKLYLYQDGPREGREDDLIGLMKCREIAADIDWKCEVHHYYQEKNVGCDPSEFIAQKWMFETEEMGIVLEDDDVPAESFFPFCKELLEKYKDDHRINMICGFNAAEVVDCPYDYFFTTVSSICGWASWKRVIDTWDDTYKILEDPYEWDKLSKYLSGTLDTKQYKDTCEMHKQEGKAFYETILSLSSYTNHRINIMASKNMISNIGVVANATHSVSELRQLPRGIRRIFNMPVYDVQFPIKHPPYMIDDIDAKKKINRVMAMGHPWVKQWRRIESAILRIRYGDAKGVLKRVLAGIRRKKDA